MLIAYDGDCPFCSAYAKIIRLKEAVGDVRLIDARGTDPFLGEIRAAGLDINSGMVARYGGRLYHGEDVLTLISLLSNRSGPLNRLLALVFRSRRRARLLYPTLLKGRNLTLRLLGRKMIDW